MDDVRTALAEQHAELWGLISDLDEAAWQRPSRCEGWSVADVVLHLAQTDELALASLQGRFDDAVHGLAGSIGEAPRAEPASTSAGAGGPAPDAPLGTRPPDTRPFDPDVRVDDGAALAVAGQRGEPGAVVGRRWRAASGGVRDALATVDPSARVLWVAGRVSATTLASTRLAECWIHTGDVAEPLGVDLVPGGRLRHVARLAWRTLPYAFAQAGRELAGPVAFHLRGPDGATWDFVPDDEPLTVVEGDGVELCLVAARRTPGAAAGLRATGPDAAAVLDLVRTYA